MKKTTIWEDGELRWSIDEIASPDEKGKAKKLMRLVKSGRPFDIGWIGLKKEIVSFNIRRDVTNGKIELSVCASMDDLPYDLMTDANEGLTYEQVDEIMEDDEYCYRIAEVSTEVTESTKLGSVTLDEISESLMKLWDAANKKLDEGFDVVKEVVAEYLKRTGEKK